METPNELTPTEFKENCNQQRRASRTRHNVSVLKSRVMVRGFSVVDRRSNAARSMLAWKQGLVRDLGGADAISAQKMALIEIAARTRLILDHADAYILEQSTLVNKRKRSLFPIIQDRTRLADSLARLLAQLGLDRVFQPVKALSEYIQDAEKTAEAADGEPAPADQSTPDQSWQNF